MPLRTGHLKNIFSCPEGLSELSTSHLGFRAKKVLYGKTKKCIILVHFLSSLSWRYWVKYLSSVYECDLMLLVDVGHCTASGSSPLYDTF